MGAGLVGLCGLSHALGLAARVPRGLRIGCASLCGAGGLLAVGPEVDDLAHGVNLATLGTAGQSRHAFPALRPIRTIISVKDNMQYLVTSIGDKDFSRMFGRIIRQNRRLIVSVLLLTLCLWYGIGAGIWEFELEGASTALMVISLFLASLIVIGGFTIVFALFFPSLLGLVEIFAVGGVVLMALSPFIDMLSQVLGAQSWLPMIGCTAVFMLVAEMLYGLTLSEKWRRNMAPYRFSMTLRQTPETVWNMLVPQAPLAREFHWPQATVLSAPPGSDAAFILCLPRRKDLKDAILEIRFETCTPFSHVRYLESPRAGSGDPETRVEISITETGNGDCTVTVVQQYLNVPFKKRLALWLNHSYRDAEAFTRARLRNRRDWSIIGVQVLRD